MKKLMVIAAVAFAAVVSNGATIKWSVTNLIGTDGSKATSAYAIDVICASATEGGTWKAGDSVDSANIFANGATKPTTISDVALGTYVFSATAYGPNGETLALGTKTVEITDAGSTYSPQWSVNNSKNDWQSVPEPTSGMLLLLGVAGLALRRRRA